MNLLAIRVAAVLATVSAATVAADSCTSDLSLLQIQDDEYRTCLFVLVSFETCSDTCVKSFKDWASRASQCPKSVSSIAETQSMLATMCKTANANPEGKYAPKVAPSGTVNCSSSETNGWTDKYESPSDSCISSLSYALNKRSCEDKCLKNLEEAIDQAPMCYVHSELVYSFRESKKHLLVKCLQLRNESLAGNAVLQSAAGKWVRTETSVCSTQNKTSEKEATSTTTEPPVMTVTTEPTATTAASHAVAWSVSTGAALVSGMAAIALSLV